MKDEKIYSIPVTEAFEKDCECPVCAMYNRLEQDAVDYAMGPSYMEADIREVTDRTGFCRKHIRMVAAKGNTLGMALVLKTHFDKVIDDVSRLQSESTTPKKSLFRKADTDKDAVPEYIETLENSCFVCDRVYMDNMKRVRDDLEWLIKKFDYRYANEPAGNSKDAIPRAIVKINSTDIDNQNL